MSCPNGVDCLYDFGVCDGSLCLESRYQEQLEWEALETQRLRELTPEELLEETEEAIRAKTQ